MRGNHTLYWQTCVSLKNILPHIWNSSSEFHAILGLRFISPKKKNKWYLYFINMLSYRLIFFVTISLKCFHLYIKVSNKWMEFLNCKFILRFCYIRTPSDSLISINLTIDLHPVSSLHGKYVEKQWKQWLSLFWGAPKSLQMVIAAMKLKDAHSLKETYEQPR